MDKNLQTIHKKKEANPLLEYVFIEELKDLYWSELIFSRLLKKLRSAAHSRATKAILTKLSYSCEMHIKQLSRIFESLGYRPKFQFFEDMCMFSEGSELAGTFINSGINGDNFLLAYAHKICKYEKNSIDGLVEISAIIGKDKLSQRLRNAGNSKLIFCILLSNALTKKNHSIQLVDKVKFIIRTLSCFSSLLLYKPR